MFVIRYRKWLFVWWYQDVFYGGCRQKCWDRFQISSRKELILRCTVYPKKYAHGFVVLCFVAVMQSFIMNSHEVFLRIHQGCFAGIGAIVRLPQCQWSKPDGYGKISQCITTTKHSKAKTVRIFLGIYCSISPLQRLSTWIWTKSKISKDSNVFYQRHLASVYALAFMTYRSVVYPGPFRYHIKRRRLGVMLVRSSIKKT